MSADGTEKPRAPRRIVVTGGPGAGKTAVLEVARRELAGRVEILPESASIVFGGGFPRRTEVSGRRSAQRAIYHVQSEVERMALELGTGATILCDRGTLDALAYWPGPWDEFFDELHTSMAAELARYVAVIHLRVPSVDGEYRSSPIRIESAREARAIDGRLLDVWATHPRRVVIDADDDFLLKTQRAIEVVASMLAADGESAPPPMQGRGTSATRV